MIEQELFAHLEANVSVNGRIYPALMPQDCAMPALVYLVVTENDEQLLFGDVSHIRYLVQIDVYAKSYGAGKQLKNEVKNALYSFKYYPIGLNVSESYEQETRLFRQMITMTIQEPK